MATARKASTEKTIHRDAVFRPKTLDEEQRTIEVIAATETPVRRWFGDEILRCDEASMDASRMTGLPVLDSHDRSSILTTLGRVESWRFQGRKLISVFRFAANERGSEAMALVKDGMVRKVSVGYQILKAEEARGSDGITTVTATKWQPYEISLVSVPADNNAIIRGVTPMPTKRKLPPVVDDQDDELIEVHDDPARTQSDASTRSAQFERLLEDLRRQGLGSGLTEDAMNEEFEGVRTISGARDIVFRMLADKSRQTPMHPNRSDSSRNQSQATAAAIIDALAVRMGAAATGEANALRGRSITDIARHFFVDAGVDARSLDDNRVTDMILGRDQSVSGVRAGLHTTSDFSMLLIDASNRALLDRYNAVATPIKGLSQRRDLPDFRSRTFIRPGEAPKLEKVSESGEIKSGTLGSAYEGFAIDTYAKMFGLSRQAIINDDLGAFSDFINAFAASAADTEGDLFFNLLSANAYGGINTSDGINFFHASHNNLASAGSAIDENSLSGARAAMRLQPNVNGTGTAGAVPAVLLVGPNRETQAGQAVAEINATTISDVNPFAGKLRVEVENRYNGIGWWLFADPASRPAFVHGYLDGTDGPRVETQDGWNVLGREFRCLMDFGCGPQDYRAGYFNPGA